MKTCDPRKILKCAVMHNPLEKQENILQCGFLAKKTACLLLHVVEENYNKLQTVITHIPKNFFLFLFILRTVIKQLTHMES